MDTEWVTTDPVVHPDAWNVQCWHIERLEHCLFVDLWVQRGLCKKDRVFFWRNSEFDEEHLNPDLFHVIQF